MHEKELQIEKKSGGGSDMSWYEMHFVRNFISGSRSFPLGDLCGLHSVLSHSFGDELPPGLIR